MTLRLGDIVLILCIRPFSFVKKKNMIKINNKISPKYLYNFLLIDVVF